MDMRTKCNRKSVPVVNITPKSLTVAVLLSLAFMLPSVMQPATAQETGGHTTGYAVTPTLDDLHEQDPAAHPQTSAYTLTPTAQTSGDNIYNLPDYDSENHSLTDRYYELTVKDEVIPQTRYTNTRNGVSNAGLNEAGIWVYSKRNRKPNRLK